MMATFVYIAFPLLALVLIFFMWWISEVQKTVALLIKKNEQQREFNDGQLSLNGINHCRLLALEKSEKQS